MKQLTEKQLIAKMYDDVDVTKEYKDAKAKPKYHVYLWDADADNTETVFEAPAKPTLEQMYKLIGCDRVERVSGYDKSVSNRTFDLWIDEEGKFNNPTKNLRATNAWYRWMQRTGYMNTPGDCITGKAVCYKKI
jgi:hypothetical protein